MAKISINPDSLKPQREWKRHKVKEGSNRFRFLPPFGEQSNGYPYRKWLVIWGLCDPESGRPRPYASPLSTGEKRCPVSEFVASLAKVAEAKKATLESKGLPKEEVTAKLRPITKVISTLRPKIVYAWNAVDQAGTVGLLELKSTAHKQLKEHMQNYIRDYNQDPTSVNGEEEDSGVWFDVKRSGEGFDTEYKVEKVQHAVREGGKLKYEDDRTPLPENVREHWEDQAYDLSSIYQHKSYDELNAILAVNLSAIVKECPEANLDGTVVEDQVEETVEEAPAPKKTSKVVSKFDDDDTDEDVEEVKETPKKSAPVSKTLAKTTAADDDIFAMADSILKS
jgi:hypothetical protein